MTNELDQPVTVEYRGTVYRRYPFARQRNHRVYYGPTGPGSGQLEQLHRQVWIDAHGTPVPAGHDVHHDDGDPFNNDPSNLVAISRAAHRATHGVTWDDPQRLADHLAAVRPLAAEAHRTPESRAKKSASSKAQWEHVEARSYSCIECGAVFESRHPTPPEYCSQRCRNAMHGRESYWEDFVCEECGAPFRSQRWGSKPPRRFCGRPCQNKAIGRERRQRRQAPAA